MKAERVADLDQYKGKLKGAIVLVGAPGDLVPPEDPLLTPFDRMQVPLNVPKSRIENRNLDELLKLVRAMRSFFDAEGAVAVLIAPDKWYGLFNMSTVSRNYQEGKVPTASVTRENFALLTRLIAGGPAEVEVNIQNAFTDKPVETYNTVAEIRGSENPDEVVIVGGHLDSWDLGTGATDNGTGSTAVLEAARALQKLNVKPKRTIRFILFTGEEQGLNGSSSFAADHPEVLKGLDVVFNQDSGTGRITNVSMQGFTEAASLFRRWFSQMPSQVRTELTLTDPGTPGGGSDEMAFVCRGVPAFSLDSKRWNYEAYTWHTNRDTFDKLVFDELSFNARVIALLAYLAAEDPRTVPREPRVTANDPATGKPKPWPNCVPAARDWAHRRK